MCSFVAFSYRAGILTLLFSLFFAQCVTARASAVTAGQGHTCAVTPDGTVQCWGLNTNGQLGDNSLATSLVPVTVSNLSGVTAISADADGNNTCAVLNDGSVQCWGYNGNGQLGNNSTTNALVPVAVIGLSGVTAIAAGYDHTCALLSGGTVQCWGANGSGQLGNNLTTNSLVPVAVSGLSGVIAIGAGDQHSCAVLSDGTAQCWGYNGYGQLGNNSTTKSLVPVAVSGLSGATAIAGGGSHTCALLGSGGAKCWGYNTDGELGNNSTTNSLVPVVVNGLSDATAIATGGLHTCALSSSGAVQCWGQNSKGQLGNNSIANSLVPVAALGLGSTTAIAAGGQHSCALLSDGTLQCWGVDTLGQLGNNSTIRSLVPVDVTGLTDATGILSGAFHTCVILADSTVQCWGNNTNGELGNNSTLVSHVPETVPGLSGVTALAAGNAHVCALLSGGTVQCWGNNVDGALGNNSTTQSLVPVPVPGLSGVTAIAAGEYHTCAVLSSGGVKCWGKNTDGELGNNSTTNSLVPISVSGLTTAVAVSGGYDHSCALLTGGTVKCWGGNAFGQLGNGSIASSLVPVTVSGLSSVVEIAASDLFTCALIGDSTMQCWGSNGYGQLGNNTTANSLVPTSVLGLSGAVSAIALGELHACALLGNGAMQCWGNNAYGQLGNNSTNDSHAPAMVPGISGATAITAGALHTCALLLGGEGKCWGYNYYGNLGNSQGAYFVLPQAVYGATVASLTPAATSVVGQNDTISFSVSTVFGTPTGSVTVTDDLGDDCGPVTLSNGAGSCDIVFTVVGSHLLTATYTSDNGAFADSVGSATQVVNKAATALTIQSQTPDPSTPAQTVTMTAAIAVTNPGNGIPTGTINVGDGVNNCTITLPATSCGVVITTRGPRTLTATYGGDTSFAGTTSAGVVHHVNRLPIAGAASYTLLEDATLTVNAAQGVLAGDSDPDGDALSVTNPGTMSASGIGGSVVLNADGSFVYTPPVHSSGTATFSYQLSDGHESVTGTVTLTVSLINEPPTFILGSDPTWPAGTSGLKNGIGFAQVTSFGAPDESGQSVLAWHVSLVSDPNGVTSGAQMQPDGTLVYSLTGQSGIASFSIDCQDNAGTANGGSDTSAPQTFQISVGAGLDLAIRMTHSITDGPDFLQGGLPVDYTITVQNVGTTDAHNAIVQDLIPATLPGAMWTCDTIGAATCTASGSGSIVDTVNIPKNAGLIYHLTATVQAIPELAVVNAATVASQIGDIDVNLDNNSISQTDTVGVFRDGFEGTASPTVITAADNIAQTQIVDLELTKVISESGHESDPVLIALVRHDADQRAAAIHIRMHQDQTQARVSWRGNNGLWVFGDWMVVEDVAQLQLAWTTDGPVDGAGIARISLVEVALLQGGVVIGWVGEEP